MVAVKGSKYCKRHLDKYKDSKHTEDSSKHNTITTYIKDSSKQQTIVDELFSKRAIISNKIDRYNKILKLCEKDEHIMINNVPAKKLIFELMKEDRILANELILHLQTTTQK